MEAAILCLSILVISLMNDASETSSILELNLLLYKIQEISGSDALLDLEMQEEIADLLCVTAKLKSKLIISQLKNDKFVQTQLEAITPNIKVAVKAIEKNSNKLLVRKLRRDSEYSIRRIDYPWFAPVIENFKNFLYKVDTRTKVLVGLFIALPIHLLSPIALAYCLAIASHRLEPIFAETPLQNSSSNQQAQNNPTPRISKYDFEETSALLILSAMAGATGSVVSIMLRLGEYQDQKYKETLLPVFIGAFKPAIGAFFGIFVFALISSALLPITVSKEGTKPINRWLAFLAITFVIGFSERLANDVVSQAEQIIPASKTSSKSPIPSEEEKNKGKSV